MSVDIKKIIQEAVKETAEELKKGTDPGKIDNAIKTIDAANMVTEIVQNTIKNMGLDAEKLGEKGVKEIAKKSAKAAITAAIK